MRRVGSRIAAGMVTLVVSHLLGAGQSGLAQSVSSPPTEMVNVRAFEKHVLDQGKETEDWQPAFQGAIAEAQKTGKPLYVPVGEYKIRKAIDIPRIEKPETSVGGPIPTRIVGDGPFQTIIHQMAPGENVINWTGPEYEKDVNRGSIFGVCLQGGNIALNIKWHNYFTMDSCYIHGAQIGVYAEGWSSRFLNSTIRWCFDTGVYGGAHFNNVVIRDCYFSRDGIGIRLAGGYGVRIDGCGLEVCANCAIFAHAIASLTINNSYFEGNGYESEHFKVGLGYPSAVHLDYACTGVSVHDNIFREVGKTNPLSLSYCVDGSIQHNTFCEVKDFAIRLRTTCQKNETFGNWVARTVVRDNFFPETKQWLGEEKPGLIDKAVERGCLFQKPEDSAKPKEAK